MKNKSKKDRGRKRRAGRQTDRQRKGERVQKAKKKLFAALLKCSPFATLFASTNLSSKQKQ